MKESQVLHLPLKRQYFEAIQDGSKTEEYRLCTPYWQQRLQGRSFSHIVLTLGYPKRGDQERRMVKPWKGCSVKSIVHPHFGQSPVQVYAINLKP